MINKMKHKSCHFKYIIKINFERTITSLVKTKLHKIYVYRYSIFVMNYSCIDGSILDQIQNNSGKQWLISKKFNLT